MTLPTTNLSLSAIQTEFDGANPISLSEYYRGGAYVPNANNTIPISGEIKMSQFRGVSKIVNWGSFTVSASSLAEGYRYYFTLSGGDFGSKILYWKIISMSGLTADDFNATTGAFVTSATSTGGFNILAVKDNILEPIGTFKVALYAKSDFLTPIVTSDVLSMFDEATYAIGAPSKTTLYRCGASEYRASSVVVTATGAPDGASIYWQVEQAESGAFIEASGIASVLNQQATITIVAAEHISPARGYVNCWIAFYSDAQRTKLIGSSSQIALLASPSFSISTNPTYAYETDTAPVYLYVTATNAPPMTLYVRQGAGTTATAANHDFPTSALSVSPQTGYVYLFRVKNDTSDSSNKTLVLQLGYDSSFSYILASCSMQIYSYSPVQNAITNVVISLYGGAQGGATRISGQIYVNQIAASARYFDIRYTNDTGNWYNLGAQFVVEAGATNSVPLLIYATDNANNFINKFQISSYAPGYAEVRSGVLGGFYF